MPIIVLQNITQFKHQIAIKHFFVYQYYNQYYISSEVSLDSVSVYLMTAGVPGSTLLWCIMISSSSGDAAAHCDLNY